MAGFASTLSTGTGPCNSTVIKLFTTFTALCTLMNGWRVALVCTSLVSILFEKGHWETQFYC